MLWWVVRLPSLRNRGLVGWMALGLLCSSATFAVWTSERRAGNAAIHLFHRHGGRLPQPVRDTAARGLLIASF